MDDLARELGMSKKTLYEHFSSKDELLHAVLSHRVASVDADLRAVLDAGMEFHERLASLSQMVHRRTSEINPVFIDDIRRYAPQYFEIVESYRSEAIPRYFGQLIAEGIRSGHISSEINPAFLTRMLLTCIQGIVRPEILATEGMSPHSALQSILHIVFRGILTAKGRSACGSLLSAPSHS